MHKWFTMWLLLISGLLLNQNLLLNGFQNNPSLPPMFFMCHYHSNPSDPGIAQSEISISVSLKENHEYYEPGKIYEVLISSSVDFDGFLVTGLYTTPHSVSKTLTSLSGLNNVLGKGLVCSIVHSHLSPSPHKYLSFSWIAPPKGTGCVDFLASATLAQTVIFKDVLVMQICEKNETSAYNDPFAVIYDKHVILKENFDSFDGLETHYWKNIIGGTISNHCAYDSYGKSAEFCSSHSNRQLITEYFNTSTAVALQFSLASGLCNSSTEDPLINIYYQHDNEFEWILLWSLQSFVANVDVHIVKLPLESRKARVAFKWEQEMFKGKTFKGCWLIDNILIINSADLPIYLQDGFDPVDFSNWNFYSGINMQTRCNSDGNAMVFSGFGSDKNYVTTRDVYLFKETETENIIFGEDFEADLDENWIVKGGQISQKCGITHHKKAFVFDQPNNHLLCTPLIDVSHIGVIRFHVKLGCHSLPPFQRKYNISLFVTSKQYGILYLERNLKFWNKEGSEHPFIELKSVIFPQTLYWQQAQICWQQDFYKFEQSFPVWTIDHIQVLPWFPETMNEVLQFEINANCENNASNTSIAVEFSTNFGSSWHRLDSSCMDNVCKETTVGSHFHQTDFINWERVTLPIPYPALSGPVRFKIHRTNQNKEAHRWAIDNIYIGNCPQGCNGVGRCHFNKCICDLGYHGDACNISVLDNPSSFSELFSSPEPRENQDIIKIRGAVMGFKCGILSTGRAAIFNKSGSRYLVTRDVNTKRIRFLEFTIRIGSSSEVSFCPSPKSSNANVFVHYSCNGGIKWHLLYEAKFQKFLEPRHVLVPLPSGAQKTRCRLRFKQQSRSLANENVWAIDDIIMTETLSNTLTLTFTDLHEANRYLHFSNGFIENFCDRKNVLRFTKSISNNKLVYVETISLTVGPSSMIQFDLIIGCKGLHSTHYSNKIMLEYSTNHGFTWELLQKPCLPSENSCNGAYTRGTTYEASEFHDWTRITINLPPITWSSSTNFRLRQSNDSHYFPWAIDNLYIGQHCPNLCSGHGYCHDGSCQCDDGFFGENCLPLEKMKTKFKKYFHSMKQDDDKDVIITGGSVMDKHIGCEKFKSKSALYFFKMGLRELTTIDLDTSEVDFVQFYILIGQGDMNLCQNPSHQGENVLLQFSTDFGTTWLLLKELRYENYYNLQLEQIPLPQIAQNYSVRFRWWQPYHKGEGLDWWILDEILIDKWPADRRSINITFNEENSNLKDIWRFKTKSSIGKYCGSQTNVLLFKGDQLKKQFLITPTLILEHGDIIYFKINIGCSKVISTQNAVHLEVSLDSAVSWTYLQKACYPGDYACNSLYREASIYYGGTSEQWITVHIFIDEVFIKRKLLLRWIQYTDDTSEGFALDDIYVGKPLPSHCRFSDLCTSSSPLGPLNVIHLPSKIIDRFENNLISSSWDAVIGGAIGTDCGFLSTNKSLCFNQAQSRYAMTVNLDSTYINSFKFILKIGDITSSLQSCKEGREDNVFLLYSVDDGVSWKVLSEFACQEYRHPTMIQIQLPPETKKSLTRFKWWQPLRSNYSARAQWAIDDVFITNTNSIKYIIEDDFNQEIHHDYWSHIEKGQLGNDCSKSNNRALQFVSEQNGNFYAETWDMEILPGTYIQFDLCSNCLSDTQRIDIALELSSNMGDSWKLVENECLLSSPGCTTYHMGSKYSSQQQHKCKRVIHLVPNSFITYSIRFRWIQNKIQTGLTSWSLDNVYIGNSCPWMCSGHGNCINSTCICDPGYVGDYCVPQRPLPCSLKDSFNELSVNESNWLHFSQGIVGTNCATVVSGSAFCFFKDGVRMAITQDLDTTHVQFFQFSINFDCISNMDNPKSPSFTIILLEYSVNGGISWDLIKEIYLEQKCITNHISIPLSSIIVKSNATRFRFWQPDNLKFWEKAWALDDIIILGTITYPNVLYDTFEGEIQTNSWLLWPNSRIGYLCNQKIHKTGLIFDSRQSGEYALYTRDLEVTENTVIQFDIQVGCGNVIQHDHPVRLEYSSDFGQTWQLVKSYADIYDNLQFTSLPSVYYVNAYDGWKRITVPLTDLKSYGILRFRWHQGHFPSRGAVDWGIDNVYIGPSCTNHCFGHGYCINGELCLCDDGYGGDTCKNASHKLTMLKESFEGETSNNLIWVGGHISRTCGTLFSGNSLVFQHNGQRVLESHDLDLTLVSEAHFYLRLGCSHLKEKIDKTFRPTFLLLQYSIDGGITWSWIERFIFSVFVSEVKYVRVELPDRSRTPLSRLRWWQVSYNGSFSEDWAIDEIYLGGDLTGLEVLNDDFHGNIETNWISISGGSLENVCGSSKPYMHFAGTDVERYAITTDVYIFEGTYIQFELSMGCYKTSSCYNIKLEYSTDTGNTWDLLWNNCLSPNKDCTFYHDPSVFSSDIYNGINRITLQLMNKIRSKTVRFRWIQSASWQFSFSWAIGDVYIGDECLHMCSGHGICKRGHCQCDVGWYGEFCNNSKQNLPSTIMETFSSLHANAWYQSSGAVLSNLCGSLGSGTALHFYEDCTRQLMTMNLDLRDAVVLQFYLKFGCLKWTSDDFLVLLYTNNNGITWSHLETFYYSSFMNSRLVSILLPEQAKTLNIRIRWIQPRHGGRGVGDWAIDDVVITGHLKPNNLIDPMTSANKHYWLSLENVMFDYYCGSDELVAISSNNMNETVLLQTRDLFVEDDYILQFSVAFGCNSLNNNQSASAIHVQYSTDYGLNWAYLKHNCSSSYLFCSPINFASIIYAPLHWRRITIPLLKDTVNRIVRFRFIQMAIENNIQNRWGIQKVFVGKACPELCNGHGICSENLCHCDKGYYGIFCEHSKHNPSFLRETFHGPGLSSFQWDIVWGGQIETLPMEIAEGGALVFRNKSPHLIETVDLDVRDARFVQFAIAVWYNSTSNHRIPSAIYRSLLLEFSTNGGITWESMFQLDLFIQSFQKKIEYIELPTRARTSSTRFRWWTVLSFIDDLQIKSGAQLLWALDDILIGGSVVNPFHLKESFDPTISNTLWWFHPHGKVIKGFCSNEDYSIVWLLDSASLQRSIITRELIIAENYMIQFKIVIGCNGDSLDCASHQNIHLQYSKGRGAENSWHLVQRPCLLDSQDDIDCSFINFHSSSVYSAARFPTWTRVALLLPEETYSSNTQFRWIQDTWSSKHQRLDWALDDVYIGEACLGLCYGRGDCEHGKCVCDDSNLGENCQLQNPVGSSLPHFSDSFDNGIYSEWQIIRGGYIGSGCNTLSSGLQLYFGGCGIREAITKEIDTRKASKILFMLRIGSPDNIPSCNVRLNFTSVTNKVILLLYTVDKGNTWKLLATHEPAAFLLPRRVIYDLPESARSLGTQFRWWQLQHDGEGHDQWAIDNVEIIFVNRNDYPSRFSSRRRWQN